MNKKVLIGLLILLLVIVGYLYFYKPEIVNSNFTGSWQDLALRGGNYHCTYYDDSGVPVDAPAESVEFFISGSKARGYSKVSGGIGGIKQDTNILRDGNDLYIWSTSTSFIEGNKVKSQAFQEKFVPNKDDKDYKYSVENFKCEVWKPNQSLFNIPSDIEFLKKAKVEIISPNGGDVYRPGDTLVIEWKKENIPDGKPSAVWAMILTPYTEDIMNVQRYRELDVQLECLWNGKDKISWVIPNEIEVQNSECPKYISRDGRLVGGAYDDRGLRVMVQYSVDSQGEIEDWDDKQSILTFKQN